MGCQQARVAARNMLAAHTPTPIRSVPFLWSSSFRTLRVAGLCPAEGAEETILHGKPSKFVAYLVVNNRVRGTWWKSEAIRCQLVCLILHAFAGIRGGYRQQRPSSCCCA